MIETYRGTVYPWHCDIFNHLNVQFYMAKFDEGAWQFFAQIGLTADYFKTENKGIVAVEQHIYYHKELVAGDLVVIKSEILEIRPKSIRFRHLMYNMLKDELASELESTGVHIDTISRKSCAFSPEVMAKLKVFTNTKEDKEI